MCNEQRRSDLVCNDTLKRIEQALEDADDDAALKQLAKRQLERFNGFPPNNRRAEDKQKWKYWGKGQLPSVWEKCDKSQSEVKDLQIPSSRPRNRQRRRSLGKLESVDRLTRQQQSQQQQSTTQKHLRQQQIPLNCGVIRPSFVVEPETQSTTATDTKALSYYLQYAGDYYKQGFLSNIQYLETVGERNQLRRKRLLSHTLRQATATSSSCNIPQCTTTTTSTTPLNESSSNGRSIQRQTSIVHQSSGNKTSANNSCNSILKNIANKHSFRIYRYNEKETEYPELNHNSGHWPIRIQIKPADTVAGASAALSANNNNNNANGNGYENLRQTPRNRATITTTKAGYSMNDYLNGNWELPQQQTPSHYNNQLIQQLRHEYPVKDQQQQLIDFDSLISNLEDLEIVQSDLPRITLTDYTQSHHTDQRPLEATSSLLSGKHNQGLNSVLLRQTSVELATATQLEIPPEASEYHSEARPPQNTRPI